MLACVGLQANKKSKHELKYLVISLFLCILEHFVPPVCQTAARRLAVLTNASQCSAGRLGCRAQIKGEKMQTLLGVVRVKHETLREEFCLG